MRFGPGVDEVGVKRRPVDFCVVLLCKENPPTIAELESGLSVEEEFSLHEAGRQISSPSGVCLF